MWLGWQRICLQCGRPGFDSWIRKILWRRERLPTPAFLGSPCDSAGKESTCNMGDLGSIPGLRGSPGEGCGNPLLYSCLGNPMGRGAVAQWPPPPALARVPSYGGRARASTQDVWVPTQGSNPGLPHCRQILYQLSHKESPRILEWVAYPFSSRSSQPRD